jgi:hypothetical protein
MIRWTIYQNETPFAVNIPLEDVRTYEEFPFAPSADLEGFVPEAEEHPTRMPICGQPVPPKLASAL